ncbi:hypothetical protein PSCICN_09260 [Pseudomonas cichorii]|nr:hypothetical protein PSCICN_09260 [Pseudomonas cichorii]
MVLPIGLIKIDNRHRQQIQRRGLCQYGRRRAVLEHVGKSFHRISRIQRHITAARLQDGQQAHHHLDTALDANSDPGIRHHTLAAQMMGQTVGTLVQFGITQTLVAKYQRNRIRRTLDLSLEQTMNGLIKRILGACSVIAIQQLCEFVGRQYRN